MKRAAAAARFTIYLSLIAFIGGGAVACIITLLRISKSSVLEKFAATFIWVFQSVPLLMLLFLIGLGMPGLLDINIDPWTAATCALVLFTSAYLAKYADVKRTRAQVAAVQGSIFMSSNPGMPNPIKNSNMSKGTD